MQHYETKYVTKRQLNS